MKRHPKYDVSDLPHSVLDHRSSIWWGNLMLLLIETTMFALLIGAYFYLRLNFDQWPPPRTAYFPINYDPVPGLKVPTINLLVILLSFVPMIIVDRAALHHRDRTVEYGLWVCISFGAVAITLRFLELSSLNFRWDENAYAGIIWFIVCMHLAHLIVGTLENLIMAIWVLFKGMDDKHARDIRVSAVYWYWIIGTWVILYSIIFIGPRLY